MLITKYLNVQAEVIRHKKKWINYNVNSIIFHPEKELKKFASVKYRKFVHIKQ